MPTIRATMNDESVGDNYKKKGIEVLKAWWLESCYEIGKEATKREPLSYWMSY
jgi:hypothetical protein